MVKPKTKKICIIVSSLGAGGAERSSAILSEMLFDLGYDIHIVSVLNKIDYPYKGTLLNLGALKDKDDTVLGKLKRLRVFKNYLKAHNFDYVIDSRTRIGFFREFIISKFIYNPRKTIYCVRSYNTDSYINPSRVFGNTLYGSAHRIIAVSNGISVKLKKKYGFKNLTIINNPIVINNISVMSEVDVKNKFILFFGRLDDSIKNISLLLQAYAESEIFQKEIKLIILGKGKDKNALLNKSEILGLKNSVSFLEYKSNPYGWVKEALFTVLTSKYEGFPRTLIESLALGTPVISVDCKSGPNEIIINENNGLLVENHNIKALAQAMDRLVEDKELYLRCKANAKSSVAHLSMKTIGLQWKTILN
ncbi:glycosyltransferase [Winogradskyella flava]|uniref:glycosyltransferase n=1 Tax=Winogradskyella flava TaxID=1884876 RepID=UPI0024932EAF|nr:glycosyltransferase [Winogradskyella flava]